VPSPGKRAGRQLVEKDDLEKGLAGGWSGRNIPKKPTQIVGTKPNGESRIMMTILQLRVAVVLIGCLSCREVWARSSQPQTRTLSGRAVDVSGNPVKGAHIVVRGGPTNVYSESDGRFEITWRVPVIVRATPRLLARDPARNLVGWAEIGENSNLEVKMAPGLTVVATLKDPEGQPVTCPPCLGRLGLALAHPRRRSSQGGRSGICPGRGRDEGRYLALSRPVGLSPSWGSGRGHESVVRS
jgi:hypothetical protein